MKKHTEHAFLRIRDRIGFPVEPKKEIRKLDLKGGQIILDYGCGIGSYTIPAAKLVGEKGKVYALDKQPSAIKTVQEKAKKEKLENIETILSNENINLPDESVDIVLLYGVLPSLKDPIRILKELYRILKPEGYLSTRYCFKMKRDKVLEIINSTNLYFLVEEKGHILNFKKIK